MPNNLQLYNKVLQQLCQWLPEERITRKRNMALLVSGLYLSMTIHLSQITDRWHVGGKSVSLVNRLRRFLDNPQVVVSDWYRPLAQNLMAVFAGKELRLIVDCTKLGFNHRLLMVGLAYRKRTLPLAWSVHRGSRGNVTTEEQIALLEQIRWLLPPKAVVWVMGDAAFGQVPFLRWLQQRGWHFVIRQTGRVLVYRAGHGWCKINKLPITRGQTRSVGWVRVTRKYNAGWYWLVLHWQAGAEEPWYLLSDRAGESKLIAHYRRRMWIEEMYGDMKGHGFDLEATHLDDADRLARLVLGVCIAFLWFISIGSWVVKQGLRHLIDRKDRRDKSYFRLGWDWLKRCQRLNEPFVLRFCPCL